MQSHDAEEHPLEDMAFMNLDIKLSYLHYLAFEEIAFQTMFYIFYLKTQNCALGE